MVTALLLAAAAGGTSEPICTDRPTKANAVCTVPAGSVQIESGLVGWSETRGGGTRTSVLQLGASVAKLGLNERADVQVGFTPLVRQTVRAAGERSTATGASDVLVRVKYRVSDKDAPVQLAVLPFVKLPTAGRSLGNGRVEGGIAVPVSLAVKGPVTLTFGPEVDLLADSDGAGRHLALINLVNLAGPVAPRLTLAGELWISRNLDPAGHVTQASADVAVAYAVSNRLQLDAGANAGLTRATADIELYTGLSIRF